MEHYPALPHGPVERIFDDVFFVRGQIVMPLPLPLAMKGSRSMTVLREGGELTVVNSMRLSEEGFAELDKLGEVKQVLRLAGFHGRDDGYYRERYGARIFAVEGQPYSRKLDAKAPPKSYLEPDVWLAEGDAAPVTGASLKIFGSVRPAEAALLVEREGGILITGDSLQNLDGPDEYTNLFARVFMGTMGFFKPCNVGPIWLKETAPRAGELRAILDWEFAHVLPGHGVPVIGNAKERYAPAISRALKACRPD
jgi:hypothetical protein